MRTRTTPPRTPPPDRWPPPRRRENAWRRGEDGEDDPEADQVDGDRGPDGAEARRERWAGPGALHVAPANHVDREREPPLAVRTAGRSGALTAGSGALRRVLDDPALGLQLGPQDLVGPGVVLAGRRASSRSAARADAASSTGTAGGAPSGRPRARHLEHGGRQLAGPPPPAVGEAVGPGDQLEELGRGPRRVEVVVHGNRESAPAPHRRARRRPPTPAKPAGEGVEPLHGLGGRRQWSTRRRSSASGSAIAGPAAGRPGGRSGRAARAGRG